ncbi:D-glycero-alpha-D-manno-heptose-1,7-bisphosphate 7-phosphatase [Aquincola tertiaricarbonis]|uniref:D-glycero-alpha-D-manno-heptose-1,7-bisphosphate 7-phosphatase n=1 Tax=Aquincola tertiaricarbonis TaxID=391953 RepID=UPI0006151EC8|nr:HAD family hydrolase [Aquincola tertiaricarbonis]
MKRAVFLDKDGTLVEDVPWNVDPALLRFTPQALPALQRLAAAGYLLVIVTNQSGLATGRFTAAEFGVLQQALLQRLREEAGIEIAGLYLCPHAPAPDGSTLCDCRKPQPGMLLQAAQAHDIDLANSWMVGDILNDVEAGRRAGCRTVLLDRGGETEWLLTPMRTPHHVCEDLASAADAILDSDAVVAASARRAAASPGTELRR